MRHVMRRNITAVTAALTLGITGCAAIGAASGPRHASTVTDGTWHGFTTGDVIVCPGGTVETDHYGKGADPAMPHGGWWAHCDGNTYHAKQGLTLAKVKPCKSDDGSGPDPCAWDATSRGNGKGTSFLRVHGTIVNLATGKASADTDTARAKKQAAQWKAAAYACAAATALLDDARHSTIKPQGLDSAVARCSKAVGGF